MAEFEPSVLTRGAWIAYPDSGYLRESEPKPVGNHIGYELRVGSLSVKMRHFSEDNYSTVHLTATPCCMGEFLSNGGQYACAVCHGTLSWLVGTLHHVVPLRSIEPHRAGFEAWCEIRHDYLTASLMALDLHGLILELMKAPS